MATTGSPTGPRLTDGNPERARCPGDTDRGRAGRTLLAALFLAVISLPLAANLAGFDGADPGAENRELAPFPSVDGSWTSIAAFPTGLSLWVDDHFGFRSVLVRWYGESRL